jgi:hypothetical protein
MSGMEANVALPIGSNMTAEGQKLVVEIIDSMLNNKV